MSRFLPATGCLQARRWRWCRHSPGCWCSCWCRSCWSSRSASPNCNSACRRTPAGRIQGRGGAVQPAPARLHPAPDGQPVFRHLPEFGQDRRHHHALLRADRLPDRLLHRAFLALGAQPAAAGRDPAVLDLAAAARVRLGRHPAQRRPAQQSAAGPGHHLQPAGNLSHRPGGLYRHGLCLSAVLHPAAVRHAGEDGPAPAGSRL